MARTILFFHPGSASAEPPAPAELEAGRVVPLIDTKDTRARLDRSFWGIDWIDPHTGTREADSKWPWLEFRLPGDEKGTLSLRCSLRVDHRPIVQKLCDENGWVAFDEGPSYFRPHQLPARLQQR